MSDRSKDSGVSLSSFFSRRKLQQSARDSCDLFVRAKFPEEEITPVSSQGYCSYTVIVGDDRIVQFRPSDHGLDDDIVSTACRIFGGIAPETEFLGPLEGDALHAYCMKRLAGVSLADLQPSGAQCVERTRERRRRTVRDFARLQATSWQHRRPGYQVRNKGLVGSSLEERALSLAAGLPDRFRGIAARARRSLGDIEQLPWTLTHGDFISSNVLVRPDTGEIMGLLDWAEAEWLPFGVGLYGLEELLGEEVDGRFRYLSDSGELRAIFWEELLSSVPELGRSPRTLEAVKQAHILGILLWHGIAFDDGRLDRVVEEGVDGGEILRLDVFLLQNLGLGSKKESLRQRLKFSLNHFHGLLVGKW
jgi:hypothetical protein